MRILHVNVHLAWAGGVETYLFSLMPRLAAAGHVQSIVYAKGDPAVWPEAFKLPVIENPRRSMEARGKKEIGEVIDAFKPDLIHLHQAYNIGVFEECLRRAPLVVTSHDFKYLCPASSFYFQRTEEICQHKSGPACLLRTIGKHCLTPRVPTALQYLRRVRWFMERKEAIGHIIGPSDSVRRRFIDGGYSPERVTSIPYFCPVPANERPRALPEAPAILFIGRLRPIKGYRYFIEALGLLPDNVKGIMIGDFTDERRLHVAGLARKYRCEERLEMLPWVEREGIEAAYRRSSVTIFPSICPETLGIVGLESLAYGVPVVAADVGGVREWLIPGRTGALVAPKDARAIAEAALPLLADPLLNERAGKAGIELIKTKFSPEHHIAELMRVYESAIGSRALAPGSGCLASCGGGPG